MIGGESQVRSLNRDSNLQTLIYTRDSPNQLTMATNGPLLVGNQLRDLARKTLGRDSTDVVRSRPGPSVSSRFDLPALSRRNPSQGRIWAPLASFCGAILAKTTF